MKRLIIDFRHNYSVHISMLLLLGMIIIGLFQHEPPLQDCNAEYERGLACGIIIDKMNQLRDGEPGYKELDIQRRALKCHGPKNDKINLY